jgi:sterol desaturase/sphingolipid hydroxylase (fatty acid hydroxylase superfamily)
MTFWDHFVREFNDFFRLGGLLDVLQPGHHRRVLTFTGFINAIAPLVPLLVIFELIWLLVSHRFRFRDLRVSMLIVVMNHVIGRTLKLSLVALCMNFFSQYALLQTSFTWYWFIYGLLVYELATFVHHYFAHKVRFLWALHAVHHSSPHITSSVTLTTFFLENLYSESLTAIICTLLGVNPTVFFLVMIIISVWSAFVHISERSVRNGRLGILEKLILTPAHHRVHHARHPLYMDTNYCAMVNVWDIVFKTIQNQDDTVPLEYGITRQMDTGNFADFYFGNLKELWDDVVQAPGLGNKFLYLVMPPGWRHDGTGITAKQLRNGFIQSRLPVTTSLMARPVAETAGN